MNLSICTIIIICLIIYFIYIHLQQNKIHESFQNDYWRDYQNQSNHVRKSSIQSSPSIANIDKTIDALRRSIPKNLNAYNPSNVKCSLPPKTKNPVKKTTPSTEVYCPNKKPDKPHHKPHQRHIPKKKHIPIDKEKCEKIEVELPKCPECPECPICPTCPKCPAVPDMSDFYHKSDVSKCKGLPDLSKYILKTEIPKCQQPDLDKYILKTQIPKCIQPDMSKYILKSSLTPDKLPNCKCPVPKLCPQKEKSFCSTTDCKTDDLISSDTGECGNNCVSQEIDIYNNYNEIISSTGLEDVTDIFNN